MVTRLIRLTGGAAAGESRADYTLHTWEELRERYGSIFADHGVRFVCDVCAAVLAYTRGAPVRSLLHRPVAHVLEYIHIYIYMGPHQTNH